MQSPPKGPALPQYPKIEALHKMLQSWKTVTHTVNNSYHTQGNSITRESHMIPGFTN